MSAWTDVLEDPPEYAKEVADLIEWAQFGYYEGDGKHYRYFARNTDSSRSFGNYDARSGPLEMFLDLIDFEGGRWFDWRKERPWLGHLEARYVGDALTEYAQHPALVETFITNVFNLARAER